MAYTVNNESKHLLIFGVPSLNLRQETKVLLSKFGKVQQLNISHKHPAEVFTETFHAVFEKIQSARMAKKMLDTKGFYGGVLHVCYAPEYETVADTRQKLLLRQRDIFFRLKNLKREKTEPEPELVNVEVEQQNPNVEANKSTINMGEVNMIRLESVSKPRASSSHDWRDIIVNTNKRKLQHRENAVIEKQFKPCFLTTADAAKVNSGGSEVNIEGNDKNSGENEVNIPNKDTVELITDGNCLAANIEIDKTLNFSTFGRELIKKVPPKPVNVIKFHSTYK